MLESFLPLSRQVVLEEQQHHLNHATTTPLPISSNATKVQDATNPKGPASLDTRKSVQFPGAAVESPFGENFNWRALPLRVNSLLSKDSFSPMLEKIAQVGMIFSDTTMPTHSNTACNPSSQVTA